MNDLAVALGLMLVIEGAMYALFPDAMKRMTAQIALLPPQQLRTAGLLLALLGFATVAVLRGMP
ncbi:MAG: DUF2065 domain-containing protein [Alphaproteobacteria bacterium]|nr:DUF2065 domain-containing protein [Alphaproteobacteria bacterium]